MHEFKLLPSVIVEERTYFLLQRKSVSRGQRSCVARFEGYRWMLLALVACFLLPLSHKVDPDS